MLIETFVVTNVEINGSIGGRHNGWHVTFTSAQTGFHYLRLWIDDKSIGNYSPGSEYILTLNAKN